MPNQNVTVYVSNLPVNSIMLWYGTTDAIPQNWSLCDGNNNTPNLKNMFVIGAGGSHTKGSSYGAPSVTLSQQQMPPHTHHFTGTETKPNKDTEEGGGRFDCYPNTSKITTSTGGDNGVTKSFEIIPPCIAIYYIMKTS